MLLLYMEKDSNIELFKIPSNIIRVIFAYVFAKGIEYNLFHHLNLVLTLIHLKIQISISHLHL